MKKTTKSNPGKRKGKGKIENDRPTITIARSQHLLLSVLSRATGLPLLRLLEEAVAFYLTRDDVSEDIDQQIKIEARAAKAFARQAENYDDYE